MDTLDKMEESKDWLISRSNLEDTIITPAFGKINKLHYKYYLKQVNTELDDIIKRFNPGEDEIWQFKGTKYSNRMIHPADENGYNNNLR